MKLTVGLALKIFLALAPAVIGGFVTYWAGHSKAADGYSTLSASVNELQGAVEQLRLQVQHVQDQQLVNHPAPAPAPASVPFPPTSAPSLAALVASAADTTGEKSATVAAAKPVRLKLKAFKRVPARLDDAKK
jgi:hypothetical protein